MKRKSERAKNKPSNVLKKEVRANKKCLNSALKKLDFVLKEACLVLRRCDENRRTCMTDMKNLCSTNLNVIEKCRSPLCELSSSSLDPVSNIEDSSLHAELVSTSIGGISDTITVFSSDSTLKASQGIPAIEIITDSNCTPNSVPLHSEATIHAAIITYRDINQLDQSIDNYEIISFDSGIEFSETLNDLVVDSTLDSDPNTQSSNSLTEVIIEDFGNGVSEEVILTHAENLINSGSSTDLLSNCNLLIDSSTKTDENQNDLQEKLISAEQKITVYNITAEAINKDAEPGAEQSVADRTANIVYPIHTPAEPGSEQSVDEHTANIVYPIQTPELDSYFEDDSEWSGSECSSAESSDDESFYQDKGPRIHSSDLIPKQNEKDMEFTSDEPNEDPSLIPEVIRNNTIITTDLLDPLFASYIPETIRTSAVTVHEVILETSTFQTNNKVNPASTGDLQNNTALLMDSVVGHPNFQSSLISEITDDIRKDPDFNPSTNNSVFSHPNSVSEADIVENGNKTFIISEDNHVARNYQKTKENRTTPTMEAPNFDLVTIKKPDPIYVRNSKGELVKKRIRKGHKCEFCGKDVKDLKRHLKTKAHVNLPKVQKMLQLSAVKPNSREPMKELLYTGDFEHNENARLNGGDYRVARLTQKVRRADEFVPCEKCKAFIYFADYSKHATKCQDNVTPGARYLLVRGRRLMSACASNANNTMKQKILGSMRLDKVTRAIRYDRLIVEFGNELCFRLRSPHNKAYICTQLRRLGKFKILAKLKNIVDIFIPGRVLDTLAAIEQMAGVYTVNETTYYKYPTVAQNMHTLIKFLAEFHLVLCIEQNLTSVEVVLKHYISNFDKRFRARISAVARESHGKNRRKKNNGTPTDDDMTLMYKYTRRERIQSYNKLYESESNGTDVDVNAYIMLAKTTLTSLQMINRRRPGDVERILIDDYKYLQRIHEAPEWQKLDIQNRDLLQRYGIMRARGKLGREVKMLVSAELQLCIEMLLKVRSKIDISPSNEYLFALPRTPLHEIRHVSAYGVMCSFSKQCHASNPESLRATRMRKHMVNACLHLELSDSELQDLASYMGHHVDTHKRYYRTGIVERDIQIFSRYAEFALALPDDEDDDDNDSAAPTDKESSEEVNLESSNNISNELGHVPEASAVMREILRKTGPTKSTKKKASANATEPSSSHTTVTSNSRKRKADTGEAQVGKVKKPRWSDEEKSTVKKYFPDYLTGKTNHIPSIPQIEAMQKNHPNLWLNKTAAAIKTWLTLNINKV